MTEPVVVRDGEIDVSEEFQMRAKLCSHTVAEYAELIRASPGVWPFSAPCTVYRVGKRLVLVDGFHRLMALREAGQDVVHVHIIDGNRTDALKAALSANITHGLRRSNNDKRRAVSMALADKTLGKLSDRKMAELCGVSHDFVSRLRGEMSSDDTSPPSEPEQSGLSQRDKIAAAIYAEPGMSDRQIAKIVGCDHKTVGAVRKLIQEEEDARNCADDDGPEPIEPTMEQAAEASGTSDSDYEPYARRPREPKESPPPALGDDEPFNLGERLDHDRSAILEIAGDYLSARQVKHFVTMLKRIIADIEK